MGFLHKISPGFLGKFSEIAYKNTVYYCMQLRCSMVCRFSGGRGFDIRKYGVFWYAAFAQFVLYTTYIELWFDYNNTVRYWYIYII